jgi:hypothetical protein
MKIFTIKASEVIYYQEEIEAKSEDEAREKFYQMATEKDLEPCDAEGFQIDYITGDDDEL